MRAPSSASGAERTAPSRHGEPTPCRCRRRLVTTATHHPPDRAPTGAVGSVAYGPEPVPPARGSLAAGPAGGPRRRARAGLAAGARTAAGHPRAAPACTDANTCGGVRAAGGEGAGGPPAKPRGAPARLRQGLGGPGPDADAAHLPRYPAHGRTLRGLRRGRGLGAVARDAGEPQARRAQPGDPSATPPPDAHQRPRPGRAGERPARSAAGGGDLRLPGPPRAARRRRPRTADDQRPQRPGRDPPTPARGLRRPADGLEVPVRRALRCGQRALGRRRGCR